MQLNPADCRLLVVDDNPMNADLLARRLARKGYDVGVASSAHGLSERVEQEGIDLILLDIEMPEISGMDALVSLRQTYPPIQLPIIMVTARSESEDVVRALEAGANDYLTKPVDFPVALARIRTQLSHKRAEESLRESEERYALATRGTNDGLWDWTLTDDTVFFSTRWKAMLGYEEDEIGSSPEEWFGRIHEADREEVQRLITGHHAGITPHFESEYRIRHKDGLFRWMLGRGVTVRDADGRPLRMAGSQTDITTGKVADPLTGLPNRTLFTERLAWLIAHHKRRPNALFAVLFLDLDRFKMINDSLGHLVGDELLIAVSQRLTQCLRATDTLVRLSEPSTLARLGGDEFAILLNDLTDPADATVVAERVVNELKQPFRLHNRELFTSASVGIALGSAGYDRPDELLRDADTAMYRAKSLGKSRYEVFDADMRAHLVSRLQKENELRNALARQELLNYYQPIVSLESRRIVGFEALVRWQHSNHGLVGPDEFIPLAEETGLIRDLGWWTLREACRQLQEWRTHCDDCRKLTINVNLSAKQLQQPDLTSSIRALLQEIGLPGEALKLELTESSIVVDPEAAAGVLTEIKSLGVSLAIDDFGTGYSSLSHLHRFPLDVLKIDRSFTATMTNKGEGMQIIRTIMPLAENLGLQVIAEGVETGQQEELLKGLGCTLAQGYYFSPAVSAEAARELLQGRSAQKAS